MLSDDHMNCQLGFMQENATDFDFFVDFIRLVISHVITVLSSPPILNSDRHGSGWAIIGLRMYVP